MVNERRKQMSGDVLENSENTESRDKEEDR